MLRTRRKALVVVAALLVCAILAGRTAFGTFVVRPGLLSDDPREFLTSRMRALQWGLPVPDGGRPGDLLFASDLSISGPADIQVVDGQGEELQFGVTYRSVWQSETGEAPGPRLSFVYVGRESGEPWRIVGGGTGP